MARAGHEESFANWMPLDFWLALALYELLFPLLPKIMGKDAPKSSSKIYPQMIGDKAAKKMKEAMTKMKATITFDSTTAKESEGVDIVIADLVELLAGTWLLPIGSTGTRAEPAFKEKPDSQWLEKYLSNTRDNSAYDAWSWGDKVWAIYSFYCIAKPLTEPAQLEEAFMNLLNHVGLSSDDHVMEVRFSLSLEILRHLTLHYSSLTGFSMKRVCALVRISGGRGQHPRSVRCQFHRHLQLALDVWPLPRRRLITV